MGPGPAQSSLAPALVRFALLDLAGMLLLAIGVMYLIQGPGAIFDAFPSTQTEAVMLCVAGIGFMGYAAVGVLREVARRQRSISR
jgi:hypothetical protein